MQVLGVKVLARGELLANWVNSSWWATILVTVGVVGFGLIIIVLAKERKKKKPPLAGAYVYQFGNKIIATIGTERK
jgi:formate-dependent nitrite reductase membrane component NrfD